MKKVISAVIFIMILPVAYSQVGTGSQVENISPGKKNIIKTSLIFPYLRTLDLSYERVVGKDVSIVFEIMTGDGIFVASPQLRYYLSETRVIPSGAFISPVVVVGNEGFGGAGAGLMVGVQRVFKEKISLDAFIGPAYFTEGVAGWGGINVGLAF